MKVWVALIVLVLVLVHVPARTTGAQTTLRPGATTMAQADSAWNSGDRQLARVRYAEVLAADSTASRAVFRLAQLDDSHERALALYRRYIVLEPDDAWGHMAEGDQLARMGHLTEALVAYEGAHAIAPGERDVAMGRARLLDRAGSSHDAAVELEAWTVSHPDDGEAWDLLGRSWMRAGRPRAAGDAFARAAQLGIGGAPVRLRAARAAAAPSVTPEATSLGDSDGNRTTRFGGSIDVMGRDGLRIGGAVLRERVANDVEEVEGTDLLFRFTAVPSSVVRLSGEAGAVRYGSPDGGARGNPTLPSNDGGWTTFHAAARLRVRTPVSGPSLDLRLDRAPLSYNPSLIGHRATRSEARATVEAPLAALRLRGIGRLAQIEAAGESPNARTSIEGALLVPLGGSLQPSVQYRASGYERPSAAGYFAPRRAESMEGGVYLETGEEGPLSLAADIGAGSQRVTEHGGVTGDWSRVWRAWGSASLALGPSRAWYVEVEAYDAPFALDGAAVEGSWRFLSISTGVRWALR